jgi:2-polyprenyl-6-methoxyphenol hydroxylase-like FAD-dependent oxidoreductase
MAVDTTPFKVIIVGGGLAGSLLANGLIGRGIEVQVYERTESHSKREGLQIRLTTPALAGMRACLSPEHLESVIRKFGPASGLKAEAPRVYHKDWTLLLDLGRFSVYGKNAPINRGVLRDVLADPVFSAGRLHYNKTFERYQIIKNTSSEERVRVHFSDGSVDECNILVGADGSYSRINQQIGLDNIRSIKRHVAFAAKCQLPTERFLKMSPELSRGPVMTWADEMSFFFGGKRKSQYSDGD